MIVIDPGHTGVLPGFDPGAVGHAGTKEAAVVLNVSKYIKELLAQKGLSCTLTRDTDDASIDELWTRVKIAEDNGADAFISIHCNAAESQQAHGYEVFVWPEDTASVPLAEAVYDAYAEAFPDMEGRGVKSARFGVLKGEFPSILIELAFLTNVSEESFLNDRQKEIAEAIVKGVMAWKGKSL